MPLFVLRLIFRYFLYLIEAKFNTHLLPNDWIDKQTRIWKDDSTRRISHIKTACYLIDWWYNY